MCPRCASELRPCTLHDAPLHPAWCCLVLRLSRAAALPERQSQPSILPASVLHLPQPTAAGMQHSPPALLASKDQSRAGPKERVCRRVPSTVSSELADTPVSTCCAPTCCACLQEFASHCAPEPPKGPADQTVAQLRAQLAGMGLATPKGVRKPALVAQLEVGPAKFTAQQAGSCGPAFSVPFHVCAAVQQATLPQRAQLAGLGLVTPKGAPALVAHFGGSLPHRRLALLHALLSGHPAGCMSGSLDTLGRCCCADLTWINKVHVLACSCAD